MFASFSNLDSVVLNNKINTCRMNVIFLSNKIQAIFYNSFYKKLYLFL